MSEYMIMIKCDVCDGDACAAQGKYRVCSEFCDMVAKEYTIKDARIAELEAIIEAAPHHEDCIIMWASESCDCWKSKVEKAQ